MNKERLLKLADHLEYGKLGHEKFDFKHITTITEIGNFCGTVGCGIGECPIAFPNDWKFEDIDGKLLPILKESNEYGWDLTFKNAKTFFNLTTTECDILFIPICDLEEQDYEEINFHHESDYGSLYVVEAYIYIGKEEFHGLNWGATKEDLAKNIRKFVELKEANATI